MLIEICHIFNSVLNRHMPSNLFPKILPLSVLNLTLNHDSIQENSNVKKAKNHFEITKPSKFIEKLMRIVNGNLLVDIFLLKKLG